jgi:hypothetical protein
MTARFQWVVFALAIALLGSAWGAGDAAAASFSREGVLKRGAMFMEFRYAALPTLPGRSDSTCPSVLSPVGEEGVEGGREAIQVAGPVVRASRRTARRTSRRQEVIYD